MNKRSERDLRNSPIFSSEEISFMDNRENLPWPTKGDTLIESASGQEKFIYPYTEWIPNDLDRLGFLASEYRESARQLVRDWLKSDSHPDEIFYTVGFLYRHSIELKLKDLIAHSAGYLSEPAANRRKQLNSHSLKQLWLNVRPIVASFVDKSEADVFETQLLELDRLDSGSDGFRYPFGFVDKQGVHKTLLSGLAYGSFDNFVWILDGLISWLATVEDVKEESLKANPSP